MVAASGARSRKSVGVLSVAAAAGIAGAVARLPMAVVAPVMMVALAGIDIVGAVVAKAWSGDRTPWLFATGAALFVLLFWVYGLSLSYGHLSTITLGWVVLVTVGSLGLDALLYDVHLPVQKWLAALAVVGLLVYLMTDDGTAHRRATEHRGEHDRSASLTVGSADDLRSYVNPSPR